MTLLSAEKTTLRFVRLPASPDTMFSYRRSFRSHSSSLPPRAMTM